MYGKIFDTIYEGTLYGHWEALVTFQQLIVLCDADGIVDMTPKAISARTSIPLRIIKKGLALLEAPDQYSRTPDQEGRRIELIDAHRPWGWHIVNHERYRHMQDADTIRAQTRDRVRRHREAKRAVTVGNAPKRHTDTDTNTKVKSTVGQNPPDPAHAEGRKGYDFENGRAQAIELIGFLNEKAGRNYKPVKANINLITALLREGATIEDMRAVIARQVRQWNGRPEMNEYLRPATLFGPKNYWSKYEGQVTSAS